MCLFKIRIFASSSNFFYESNRCGVSYARKMLIPYQNTQGRLKSRDLWHTERALITLNTSHQWKSAAAGRYYFNR